MKLKLTPFYNGAGIVVAYWNFEEYEPAVLNAVGDAMIPANLMSDAGQVRSMFKRGLLLV